MPIRKQALYVCALLVTLFGGRGKAEACRENITIYLDRTQSMFVKDKDGRTPFLSSLDLIENFFIRDAPSAFMATHLEILTFGSNVLAKNSSINRAGFGIVGERQVDLDLDWDSSSRNNLRQKLNSLRDTEPDPQGTDIAVVVKDILESGRSSPHLDSGRDVFIVMSDFIHESEQATEDKWLADLNKVGSIQELKNFFSSGDAHRTLLLFYFGAQGEQRRSVQSLVLGSLKLIAHGHVGTYAIRNLNGRAPRYDEASQSLLAILKPIGIKVKYESDKKQLRVDLWKQSCAENLSIDYISIDFLSERYKPKSFRCPLTVSGDESDPSIIYIKGKDFLSENGLSLTGSVAARSSEGSLSEPAFFRLEPFLELVEAKVEISDGRITVTPLVRGQPPFDKLKLMHQPLGSDSKRETHDIFVNKSSEFWHLDVAKPKICGAIVMPKSSIDYCGNAQSKMSLRLASEFGGKERLSDWLNLSKEKEKELGHGEYEFAERAAIPGATFLVLLLVSSLFVRRINLRLFVELLEIIGAIIVATFAVIHYASDLGESLERKIAYHSEWVSPVLILLAWSLVAFSFLRGSLEVHRGPATLDKIATTRGLSGWRRGVLLWRWGGFLLAMAMGVGLGLKVHANRKSVTSCVYESPGFEEALAEASTAKPGQDL